MMESDRSSFMELKQSRVIFIEGNDENLARISEQSNSVWCIDSGCTGHMCNDKHMIKGFTRLDNELNLANHESTQITGMGQVSISVDTGCEKRLVDIQKVFYAKRQRMQEKFNDRIASLIEAVSGSIPGSDKS
ncbi:hypothetical protein SFRURICE_021571 [Spodoptera frugiperda]|nr:hypothetical protein SFRURICE_021571 [Spodoptera frugiperda]